MLVYFICTGNTCRSPMAAALYYKHLNDNGTNYVQVESTILRSSLIFPLNG